MIADNIVADNYLLANLRRDIADDIIAGSFILFGVDSEHEGPFRSTSIIRKMHR